MHDNKSIHHKVYNLTKDSDLSEISELLQVKSSHHK